MTALFILLPPYIPERLRHRRACEELGLYEEIEAGCFLAGHPEIHEPIGSAMLGFGDERVFLFGARAAPLGSVSYNSVLDVTVERHAAGMRRFSEARLMLLGHRWLAFRARDSSDGSYVVVEWIDRDGERHDGIFCFEGLAADNRARRCADAILHYAATARRGADVPFQEVFSRMLDAFESRTCEHCGKVHRARGSPREKSAA